MATVNFIRNKKQSPGALGGAKKYVEQEMKMLDNGIRLVSGQNCTPQFADKEFLATRMMHRKESPVYFYHYTQSFHPDEKIDGPQAHEIAKEFAARAWPESEVLIATHIDAAHIHSHFIVNAVCYESGKMLRQSPNTLKQLRQISDEICLAHGLSVITPQQTQKPSGMGTREYRSAAKRESWKFQLMNAIDQCMAYAATRDDFIALMQSEGYDVKWTDSRKNITYTTPTGMRCRDDRLHEEKYLKENMEHEFTIRETALHGGAESAEQTGPDHGVADREVRHTDGEELASGDFTPQWSATTPGASGRYAGNTDDSRGRGGNAASDSDGPGKSSEGPEQEHPELHHTGWESERELFYKRRYGDYDFGEAHPQHSEYREDADHTDSPHIGGLGDLADGLISAAVTLAALSDTGPVRDATTMRQHIDSKALREKRRKQIAMGHKPDDHEDEQPWSQRMF